MNTFEETLSGLDIKKRNENPQFNSLEDNRMYIYTENNKKKNSKGFINASATAIFTELEITEFETIQDGKERARILELLG